MTRRTGKEGLHTRVRKTTKQRTAEERAVRKAELIRDTDYVTHWEGCESCHPKCAELRQLEEEDTPNENHSDPR